MLTEILNLKENLNEAGSHVLNWISFSGMTTTRILFSFKYVTTRG